MPDFTAPLPPGDRTEHGTPPPGATATAVIRAEHHNQVVAALTELRTALTGAALVRDGDARLTDPRTPTAHTHPVSGVVGLDTTLDALDDAVTGLAARADTAVIGVTTTGGVYPARPSHPGSVLWLDPDVDPGAAALARDVWLRRAVGS